MKKKIVLSVIAAAMVLSNRLTAFAAPELLEVDGQTVLFDSEYYAENNTDVTAVYGTDKNALARHYVTIGISEGRLPYAPGTDVSAYRPVQEKKVLKKTERYPEDGSFKEESFYDAQGNMTRTARYDGYDGRLIEERFYDYDARGNLIREGRSDGSYLEEYAYDDAGNQISWIIKTPSSYSEEIWRYDNYGNRICRLSRSSPDGEMNGTRWEYEYDSQGRTIKKTECDNASGKIWTETEYSYETRGNMNIVTETRYRFINNAGTRNRYFDGIEEYVYDNNGNEIKSAEFTVDKHKQVVDRSVLVPMDYQEHVYDSQGNLIKSDCYMVPLGAYDDQDKYVYDLDTKMLIPASGDRCVVPRDLSEYNYDSLGNLIRLTNTQYMSGVYAGTDVTEYEYDSQGNRTMKVEHCTIYTKQTFYTKYIYE